MTTVLSSRKIFCLWLALACALIAADQWLKMLVVDQFLHGQSVSLTSFFNLVRAHNTGAAFSFLADAGGWQHWFFVGVASVVVVSILVMLWYNSTQKMISFAMACILAGAIGNVIDRVRLGYVVDFLDFHWGSMHFPAFNLADIAICVGAGVLILNELIQLAKKRNSKKNV
ncbi:MAG: signal peptidase II [Saezia sp.]